MNEPMYTAAAVERIVGEVLARVIQAVNAGNVAGLEFTVAINPEEMIPDGEPRGFRVKFPAEVQK